MRRRMLASLGGGAKMPTARDYVQDGLIAMWDGIENAGWGVHDNNSLIWKDLVGDLDLDICAKGKWLDDCLLFDNTSAMARRLSTNPLTLECCFSHDIIKNGLAVVNAGARGSGSARNELNRGVFYNQNSSEGLGYYFDANELASKIVVADGSKKTLSATWEDDKMDKVTLDRYNNSVMSEYSKTHSSAWGDGSMCIGGSSSYPLGDYPYGGKGRLFCLRHYSRVLSTAEIAHNYAIDKARFNLP